jgi:C4-dicarboxylate-specific signal transduction histidine kinase
MISEEPARATDARDDPACGSDPHCHEARRELAHADRVVILGQLSAWITHEVSQPIAGAGASGHAALLWLANEPPDLEAARRAIERMIRDVKRAGDVVGWIRELINRAPHQKDSVDINQAIGEVLEFTDAEVARNGLSVKTQLAGDLPLVGGDRVELRQVILNLIINAMEAMSGTSEGARELLIMTGHQDSSVVVTVKDSGPGLTEAARERAFDPFYTTKPNGLGMGLSICRSIAEAHGGGLWAEANVPGGAIFRFSMPVAASAGS